MANNNLDLKFIVKVLWMHHFRVGNTNSLVFKKKSHFTHFLSHKQFLPPMSYFGTLKKKKITLHSFSLLQTIFTTLLFNF